MAILPSRAHCVNPTDITVEVWGLTYPRTLPQTQFPDTFLFNLTTIFRQYDGGPAIVTRDEMSLEDWEKEERPRFWKKGGSEGL